MNGRELLSGGNGVLAARRLISGGIAVLCVVLAPVGFWSASAFAAGAPAIDNESVAGVSATAATLGARIDPAESATSYRFEYGATVSYGSSIPMPDAPIGAGSEAVAVSQLLTGLQPDTAYHYRVVATSAEGVAAGQDRTLKTFAAGATGSDSCPNAEIRGLQSSAYLPDCRAYEMVSPVDKEGANIAAAQHGLTESSVDGNAIKYVSSTAFGDATGIQSRGAEYLARREPQGWVTHSVTPEQDAVPGSGLNQLEEPAQYMVFSPDLSEGVYLAGTPLVADHPNVERVSNLYLRTDLFAAPLSDYELLSDSYAPIAGRLSTQSQGIAFAGASSDFSHVIFETYNNLTPETSGLDPTLPKLYEWVNGVVRLAGVLPDGTPASESIAGKGAGGGLFLNEEARLQERSWELNAISTDGSRVIFEGPPLQEFLIATSSSEERQPVHAHRRHTHYPVERERAHAADSRTAIGYAKRNLRRRHS